MLSLASQSIKDASVLRRLEFAAGFLQQDMPNYYEHVLAFALKGKEDRNAINPDQARLLVENIQLLDSGALASEKELVKEITMMKSVGNDAPLGVILISSRANCRICGSKLYIRGDRMSRVIIYDDKLGTQPATHYTRYCRRKGCSLQQHCGYCTLGDSGKIEYDDKWRDEPYFMSSRETAFCMDMLNRLDMEILIGQISYKQRAELYNAIHGYLGNGAEKRYIKTLHYFY
jgi:hypothetical protein